MKSIIIILVFINSVFTQSIQNELDVMSNNSDILIKTIEPNILKIERKHSAYIKYVDITDRGYALKKSADGQIFDLINTPDSIYDYRYKMNARMLVMGGLGYPLVIDDMNNNGKVDFAGIYKVIQDHEIGQIGICEMQNDSFFPVKYINNYYDSVMIALSITDVNNDGLKELNCRGGQTFINYNKSAPDSFPTHINFEHLMWSGGGGMIGSETFVDMDNDQVMDVIYVGDDSLVHGNQVFIAEYDSSVNNFVRIYNYQPADWAVSGISYGDFDQDGLQEFIIGSIHGYVYVFENTADNSYELIHTDSVGASNAYLNCATNDIDKNGKKEFFIGASSYFSGVSGTKVCWFEADGNNNYIKRREFFINGSGVLGTTELYSYDVNADGTDDLVFAFSSYVLILIWDNEKQEFELFYMKYLNLGFSEISSTTVHDINNNNKPFLFIGIEDYRNEPGVSTFCYKPLDLISGFERNDMNTPQNYKLYQNYPNPFNNSTTIKYYLPKYSKVSLFIYDINGKEVKRLINDENIASGRRSVTWRGKNNYGKEVSSGLYFYQLKTDKFILTKKLLFLK